MTARDSLQKSDIASARNENSTNYLPPVPPAGETKVIKKNPSILRNSSQYEKNNSKRQLQNEIEPEGKQQTRTQSSGIQ